MVDVDGEHEDLDPSKDVGLVSPGGLSRRTVRSRRDVREGYEPGAKRQEPAQPVKVAILWALT
jgi:hypothetical protein